MSNIIYFILGLTLGGFAGIFVLSLVVNRRIQESYAKGFERGKHISANSIK